VFIVDWGPADARRNLSIADHVSALLVPLLESLPPRPALVGYCIGGTMAMAAASLAPIAKLVTIATPWHFAAYPEDARLALARLWRRSRPIARRWGVLPMEVLQAAFWSLDRLRVVAKFAAFADLDPESDEARRFVALEEWANQGEPLPLPAARELFELMFLADCTGAGEWSVGGVRVTNRLATPHLCFAARPDRIVPAASAPVDSPVIVDKGHVGMIVGSNARELLYEPIAAWLAE
jgi:polyhydroxyalkanoate synthase